jgi:hypothetical protein
MIEDGAAEAESLQSVRVVADHIAAWEALDELPAPIERCVKALEEEAMTFTYEHSATRLLKPRIEQDIRNYNAAQYANRLLVPVIFEMGRAGVVFGFYNDSEGGTANRGKLDSILLEYATTFNHKLEIWDAVTTGYHSKRSTRTALSFITHYYSLMDMPELAENEKARALIAAIPPKPVKVEQQEAQRRPQAPEEGYLKLWGWEIPVPKEIVPNALTQDLKLPELAEGLGKSAKKILATEIKNPFRNKKDQ